MFDWDELDQWDEFALSVEQQVSLAPKYEIKMPNGRWRTFNLEVEDGGILFAKDHVEPLRLASEVSTTAGDQKAIQERMVQCIKAHGTYFKRHIPVDLGASSVAFPFLEVKCMDIASQVSRRHTHLVLDATLHWRK